MNMQARGYETDTNEKTNGLRYANLKKFGAPLKITVCGYCVLTFVYSLSVILKPLSISHSLYITLAQYQNEIPKTRFHNGSTMLLWYGILHEKRN